MLKSGDFEKIKETNRLRLKECHETKSLVWTPYIPMIITDYFLDSIPENTEEWEYYSTDKINELIGK